VIVQEIEVLQSIMSLQIGQVLAAGFIVFGC
jgi:hypothetical protein